MSHKGKSTAPVKEKETKRGSNWGVEETHDLLDAAQEVQSKKSKYGFNFKETEVKEIFEIFSTKGPHGSKWVDMNSTRKKPNIGFKLKVLRREFLVCHDLATQSGWSWDDDKHQPRAPSQEDLINAIETKGDKAKWLKGSKFPWYNKMKMFGGQSARGDHFKDTFEPEPLLLLPPVQQSMPRSEQGSSDEGNEFPNDNDTVESARPASSRARSSYKQGASSSGNKRKSTDESREENSRRTKYQEANRRRQAGLLNIAKEGFEIAAEMRAKNAIMRARNDQLMSKEQQEDLCIEKLEKMGINDTARDYCIHVISTDKGRMKWILKSDDVKIKQWLIRNNIYHNQEHATNDPQGFSAMLSESGPSQQPHQHGTTFFGNYSPYGQPPNY